MKKIINIILTLAVVLSLTGCGDKKLSDAMTLSHYDEASGKYINEYTGLELTLPDYCSIIDVELLLGPAFNSGHTTDEIKAMTSEQLAELDRFTDYCVYNKKNNDILMVAVEDLASYGGEEEYVNAMKRDMTSVFKEGTIKLSGAEYNYMAGKVGETPAYFYWKIRGDGHSVTVGYYPKNTTSPEYPRAMFNGGIDDTVDEANVPDLCEYNEGLGRLINTYSDISVDIRAGWWAADKDQMAKAYYGTDAQGLATMTKAQMSEYPTIYDMYLQDMSNNDQIAVRYLRRNATESYGLDLNEFMEQAKFYLSNSDVSTVYYDSVDVGGHSYSVLKSYYNESDLTFYYLFRNLNEDYFVQILLRTENDTTLYDLVEVLGSNNDSDMLLQRSEYNRDKRHFYNNATDLGLTAPKEWYRIDQEMLDWLYQGELTVDQLENWTEQDYLSAHIVPDYGIASPDNGAYLLAYYINLNKVYPGEVITAEEYYQAVVSDAVAAGYTINEKDVCYLLGDHEFTFIDAVSADGEKRVFAVVPVGDDYAAVYNYHITNTDGTYPDLIAMVDR